MPGQGPGPGREPRRQRRADRPHPARRALLLHARGAEPQAQVKALHDMRIAAKRLRYVLEVTAFCFGPCAGTALRRAKELQDLLGEIHDCDEMLLLVRAAVRDLRDEDVDGLVALAADEDALAPGLGAAVGHADAYGGLEVLAVWLEARRMLLFERFLDRWKGLERNDFRGQLERALAERPEPGEAKQQPVQPTNDGQVSSGVPA
ncbi:MAG TPA: CHAD domain-containing protein [Solirubrobacteraceae bacterium]|nr:CHAD domain-containing protein [Solirubrobacteraceae bacterium]